MKKKYKISEVYYVVFDEEDVADMEDIQEEVPILATETRQNQFPDAVIVEEVGLTD